MSDPIALARLNARFWSKVDPSAGPSQCWPFIGCIAKSGYGRILAGKVLGGPAVWIAPRVAYALTFGNIPEGAELDHLCHTRDRRCVQGSECPHRRCVNPAHLEPVSHHENALRRESRRDHFRCGHPFAGNRVANGGVGRCAECHRTKERVARAEGRRAASRTIVYDPKWYEGLVG